MNQLINVRVTEVFVEKLGYTGLLINDIYIYILEYVSIYNDM